MALISRQTKEIINIVLFLLIAGLLFTFYIVYPLNRTKVILGRVDIEEYTADSLPANDATSYFEVGLAADTFRVETDGKTNLACLYIPPSSIDTAIISGTAFLIHGDGKNRDDMVGLARQLFDSGWAVVTFDQRAVARSSGKYFGDGQPEATDIQTLVADLELRNRIFHPLVLVGFDRGADGALLASSEEARINGVVAINPYLTTQRMQDMLKERYDTYWFPFYRYIMWFWYEIRSGSAITYRKVGDIKPVACPTIVITAPSAIESDELHRLVDQSDKSLLMTRTDAPSDSVIVSSLMDWSQSLK